MPDHISQTELWQRGVSGSDQLGSLPQGRAHMEPAYGFGAPSELPSMLQDVSHASGGVQPPVQVQAAMPAYQPGNFPDQLQHSGMQNGFGALAESGGPVAVAKGYAGAQAEVQVLADDVKSLLR